MESPSTAAERGGPGGSGIATGGTEVPAQGGDVGGPGSASGDGCSGSGGGGGGSPRVVFISASFLVRYYADVPPEVMHDAIFFFGSKRSWMFPITAEERLESRRQPTDYLSFPRDFLDLILEKEKQGLVYYLKPEMDYKKVSAFFEGLIDPVTGLNYKPLKLDDTWWRTKYRRDRGRTSPAPDGSRVVANYKLGEHDYNPTMELLAQSNENLRPVLRWPGLQSASSEARSKPAPRSAAARLIETSRNH